MTSASLAEMAALGKLFEEHTPRLLQMVERRLDPRLRRHVEPGTILNDAFLLAHQKWSQFRAGSTTTPYAWLYRLTLDCLITAWRKHFGRSKNPRDEMLLPDAESVELGSLLIDPGTSPTKVAARSELQELMRQAMRLLSQDAKEILWMRHYDNLKFKEISAVLGITENAASVRYFRALEKLREHYIQLHGQPTSGGLR